VGVNGAGKSTLIKLMTGVESPTSGTVKLGHNVVSEYFAQDQYKVLDGDSRMLDDMSGAAVKVPHSELRSLLGCFLFSGDDVFKPLGVLSGGERNRYALARILVSPSNFLLLDEPTNHLDMRAKDVLLESLEKFTGTVVFVSHDRYFIDKLATRVFEIGEGEVRVFPGNYEDYLWRKSGAPVDLSLSAEPAASVNGHAVKSEPAPAKRVNPIKLRQMQDRCQELEQEVAHVETQIAAAESELANFVSTEETIRAGNRLERHRSELAAMLAEWEQLSQTIESA